MLLTFFASPSAYASAHGSVVPVLSSTKGESVTTSRPSVRILSSMLAGMTRLLGSPLSPPPTFSGRQSLGPQTVPPTTPKGSHRGGAFPGARLHSLAVAPSFRASGTHNGRPLYREARGGLPLSEVYRAGTSSHKTPQVAGNVPEREVRRHERRFTKIDTIVFWS